MKYTYQARSKEGKIEKGIVEASSKEAAVALLQKYSVFVTSIREQRPFIFKFENFAFLNRVSKKDLAVFSRQLAVMLHARVSVTQSLKSLAIQTKNRSFKEKILKISQLVEEGNPLSDAFSAFPEIFNIFYVSLIKTGEASGKIADSLYYLSDHLEREHDIMAQIKGAMIYPAFVICLLVAVIILVMLFVMPKLVDLLKQTTAEPPFTAKVMIGFYAFLQNYGWVVISGFFLMVLFIAYYFTTKEGKKNLDKLILKLPILSGFFKKIFLIRFTENISTLISAGLSINKAIKITKDTVDNVVYKQILDDVERGVSEGEKISAVLVKYPDYAPPFVVQMMQVGEETGTLDKNLMEIVNFYQKEVNRAVATFTSLLEPILIIFLGAVVALMAISVLEPLYGTLETL